MLIVPRGDDAAADGVERGDWTAALTLAGGLGISLTWLPPAQALDWAIDARRIDSASANTKH